MHLPDAGIIRIGGGVAQAGDSLVALRAGPARNSPGSKLWIEGRQKRYIPAAGDTVVGVVTDRGGESYEVDVGGPLPASLPALAFENATRRNRPMLKEGDLVYCRVESADRDLQPLLSCVNAAGKAAGFGPLKGGMSLKCSTALARSLLATPPHPALTTLGAQMKFELAVGANGRVWVSAATAAETVAAAVALQAAEGRAPKEAEAAARILLKRLALSAEGDATGGHGM
jgi:exosome complex component RRP40